MTLDPKDYEPRPADDLWAGIHVATEFKSKDHVALTSLIRGDQQRNNPFAACPQLGCKFSELPHG